MSGWCMKSDDRDAVITEAVSGKLQTNLNRLEAMVEETLGNAWDSFREISAKQQANRVHE